MNNLHFQGQYCSKEELYEEGKECEYGEEEEDYKFSGSNNDS